MRLSLGVLAVGGAIAIVSLIRTVPAHDHETGRHGGVPSRIIANQRAGPYVVSAWTDTDVGEGTIYVVVNAAGGLAFTPPARVRVGVAPVSGRTSEVVHDAHGEAYERGERFTTQVRFDRAEQWIVRVVIMGPSGGGQLVARVESKPNAMLGRFGLLLSSLPFVIVAVVWWRASIVRQRKIERRDVG
jgi:hypothetical protein